MWLLCVADTPSQHPRITESERKYIESSIGGNSGHIPASFKPLLHSFIAPSSPRQFFGNFFFSLKFFFTSIDHCNLFEVIVSIQPPSLSLFIFYVILLFVAELNTIETVKAI